RPGSDRERVFPPPAAVPNRWRRLSPGTRPVPRGRQSRWPGQTVCPSRAPRRSCPLLLRSGFHLTMRNPPGIVLTGFQENERESDSASVWIQLRKQPGSGVNPMTLGRCARDAEHLGGLFQAATREKAELDHLSLLGVQCFQPFEGLIERHEVNRMVLCG